MLKYSLATVWIKANTPLIWRVIAFLITFVVAAAVPDWRALQFELANSYGFGFYGEAGKALFVGVIAFVLLLRRSKVEFEMSPWRLSSLLWLLGVVTSEFTAWFAIGKFELNKSQIEWLILAHLCLISVLVFLLLFAFGARNLYVAVVRKYRTEFLVALGLSVIFEIFLVALYKVWPYMSSTILFCVKSLFDVIGMRVAFMPPYTLVFNKFSVAVGEYCSGIDSAVLFTALYGLIGVLDWRRLNHRRYLILFMPALLLLFGLNIVRVFLLILAGYYINPQIAFSLFHTYAGMAFFIVYSAVFLSVSYGWILKRKWH